LARFHVFMPLRGADPFLRDAIHSVLDQDYPDLRLHIVLDSDRDPAFGIVQSVLESRGDSRATIEIIQKRDPERSLLCSGLLQVFDRIRHEEALLTFAGGDEVQHRAWLRLMGSALADPTVCGTLGNRWYVPATGWLGSLIRCWWNYWAVIHMRMNDVPWGGTLALRIQDVVRSGLDQKWATGMVEDAPTRDAIRHLGMKFQFVPRLMIINREETDLSSAYRFIARQTLWTRLYHSRWLLGITAMIGGQLVSVMYFGHLALALANRAWGALLISQACNLAVYASVVAGYQILDRAIRQQPGYDDDATSEPRAWRWIQLALTMALSFPIMVAASVQGVITRRIRWRGIEYRIETPFRVRMLNYQPFTESAMDVAAPASIDPS
ncbi:MAG: glycosyltransferase family 2 protein, partial [Planctomycetota bacterium]